MQASTKGLKANTVLHVTAKGSKYNPSANSMQNNAASWQLVTAACGTKGATFSSLQGQLQTAVNHGNFVGYAVRRGWLAAK